MENKIMYRVSGQTTLEEIAENFHTTPAAIAKLNKLDSEEIFVGMRLLIEPREGEYYIVQPFDTVSSIARKFGVSEEVVKEFNSDRVFIGQKLFICCDRR
ncbi:MAG: LysM peptidoglycan-binding domain-containing protein [Clostridia bacterium]|nr:LysM peptidoglycan-binding domain-containing protein [Clostridia bacterium]